VTGFSLDESMHPSLPVAVETVRSANYDFVCIRDRVEFHYNKF